MSTDSMDRELRIVHGVLQSIIQERQSAVIEYGKLEQKIYDINARIRVYELVQAEIMKQTDTPSSAHVNK